MHNPNPPSALNKYSLSPKSILRISHGYTTKNRLIVLLIDSLIEYLKTSLYKLKQVTGLASVKRRKTILKIQLTPNFILKKINLKCLHLFTAN